MSSTRWKEIAADREVSSAQVALAWLVDHPAVSSVILGARTIAQLADNMAAADLELSGEENLRLTEVSQPRPGVYPYGPMARKQRSRKIEGGR